MSILFVPPSQPYPPGITGDPYTPWPIDVFFDMNWPGRSGMVSKGITFEGLQGLGDTTVCIGYDEDGNCDSWETEMTGGPAPGSLMPPIVTTPEPNCNSFALTAAEAAACGQVSGTPGSGSYVPLNTPVTMQQAGLTPAQQAQLIAAIGNSTVSLIRTASGGPYTVAGTNLVYNPATGQLTTSVGANASALASSISSYLPMIGLALAAIIIVPSLLGRK